MLRAAAECFDTDRTTSRVGVQEHDVLNAGHEHIEERFAQAVGSGPHVHSWYRLQATAAKAAGNDSQLLILPARSHTCVASFPGCSGPLTATPRRLCSLPPASRLRDAPDEACLHPASGRPSVA